MSNPAASCIHGVRRRSEKQRFSQATGETHMQPLVTVIMGSKSDWPTMTHAVEMLDKLDVPCEVRVLSAHRTPDQLFEYVAAAEKRGVEVVIAAAGGAAHLAGVI